MFFIVELQHRPDGVINQTTTGKASFASAMSYYNERKSRMYMTDLYTKVALMVTDADLNVIEQAVIPTLYQVPAAE